MISLAPRRVGWLCVGLLSVSANIQAAHLNPGDLILSEFMANPTGISDTRGEWLELFNATTTAIDLRGLTLSDDGRNHHVITAPDPVWVTPKGFTLLGRSANIDGASRITVDYVYRSFSLSNTRDEIVLSEGSRELLRLDYTAALVATGRSTERRPLMTEEPRYAFTPITLSYDGGRNKGTPGRPNSQPLGLGTAPIPTPLPAGGYLFLAGVIVLAGYRGRSARPFLSYQK